MAPSLDAFYEFLGGGKPKAAAGGSLEDMLDAEEELEFNPNDVEMASSKLDINLDDGPPKKKDPSQMTLAEQLAAQREAIKAKAEGGGDTAAERKPPPKKDPS